MGFVDAVLVTLDIVYPDVFMPVVSGIVVSLLALAALGIIFVCIGVVILSVSRHEALGFGPGLVIVAPVVLLVLAGQVIGQQDVIPRPFLNSLFILASAVCFWLAVTRYNVLRKRPGTSALGERAVIEDMQEIILVINDAGEVVRSNRRAQQLSGEDEDVSGTDIEDLLDTDVQTLRNNDVITQWTTDGRKRFDPRVSAITGGTGQKVGNAVTLIDVTGREIREQRIQVLNRILRHNIRNEVSVIDARAELAMDPDQSSGEHLELISEVAKDLEGLSSNARQIEKLMQESQDRVQSLRIDDVTESVASDVLDDDGVTVETDLPAVSLRLDPGLLRYALRQLIENAVEHNDADTPRVRLSGKKTSSGVEIVVSDNGPGIPKAERDVIVAGSETSHDHASSLGLWGTNWAAQTLGGTLSFEQSSMGGAAVRLELPATDTSTHDPG
jgi:signal transduction histidine kinase